MNDEFPENDQPPRRPVYWPDDPWATRADEPPQQPVIHRREPLEEPQGMPTYAPRPFDDASFLEAPNGVENLEPPEEVNYVGRYDPPLGEQPYEPTPFDAPLNIPFEPVFKPVEYVPDPPEETVRQSGLAWSAGVVFFGSVAFMMFLGWGADLLLGTSPWGLVGGIVLGSIIGFIQFFRISSQIFSKKEPQSASFLSDDENR